MAPSQTRTGQDQVQSDQESRSRLPGRTRDVSQQQAAGSVQRRLEEIVAKELQQLSGDSCPWKATVKLTEQVPDKLLQARGDVTVESLQEAREGTFQLVACVSDGRARARVPFEARAHKLIPVVVPVHPLVRGEMVRANDVELRYVDKTSESGAVVQRLADAVGHQTRQSVSADQPLSVRSLQQPLLVRKNEEVDVMVRCGAIRAHRRAVALDNGTRGDMITVETTDGSQTQFNARVVDIRQVEVLPNSTSVRSVTQTRMTVMKTLLRAGELAMQHLDAARGVLGSGPGFQSLCAGGCPADPAERRTRRGRPAVEIGRCQLDLHADTTPARDPETRHRECAGGHPVPDAIGWRICAAAKTGSTTRA